MRILLTGGAGFIGSHVTEQLVSYGYEVAIIDNLSSSSTSFIPDGTKLYQMDINDSAVESVFKIEKPDIVIHLAAQTSVVHSMREPYFDLQTNTAATVKLLQYAARNGVRQFIFASSAAVYGEPVYLPIDEHHPIDPHSFYAVSKSAAERYIMAFGRQHDITPTILRFSNVYGPRQSTSGEAGVVGLFILKLMKNENCIIYGGSQTRDFIFVKDVATACARSVMANKSGIFNISSNSEMTIGDLNQMISDKMSIGGSALFQPYREGELIRSVLSNEKALKELEWNPDYSISDGLNETIKHYNNYRLIERA